MILHCNFEELAALTAAATRALERSAVPHGVMAPAQPLEELEALLPRLVGDITIESLAAHERIRRAVRALTDELRERMDATVLEQHPAAEDAVLAYFDYAHALSVLQRTDALGREMIALVEVLTGEPPASERAQRFTFPE